MLPVRAGRHDSDGESGGGGLTGERRRRPTDEEVEDGHVYHVEEPVS